MINQGEDPLTIAEKQLDLDETVLGFQGAESRLQYLGRFTEALLK